MFFFLGGEETWWTNPYWPQMSVSGVWGMEMEGWETEGGGGGGGGGWRGWETEGVGGGGGGG